MRAAREHASIDDPSVGDLISRLADQAGTLVREEVDLATAELTYKARRAGKGVGLLAAGAALGYAGLLSFIAMAIILLSIVVKPWIAAIVITGIVLAGALILVELGLANIKREKLAPEHTLETVREDVAWMKARKP